MRALVIPCSGCYGGTAWSLCTYSCSVPCCQHPLCQHSAVSCSSCCAEPLTGPSAILRHHIPSRHQHACPRRSMRKLLPRVQLTGYASAILHPLIKVLDGPHEELRRDALDTICAMAVALHQVGVGGRGRGSISALLCPTPLCHLLPRAATQAWTCSPTIALLGHTCRPHPQPYHRCHRRTLPSLCQPSARQQCATGCTTSGSTASRPRSPPASRPACLTQRTGRALAAGPLR